MSNEQLVSKVWNYAHVLRDQGISYGDYIEQITYLLFAKRLDDLHTAKEKQAHLLKKKIEKIKN